MNVKQIAYPNNFIKCEDTSVISALPPSPPAQETDIRRPPLLLGLGENEGWLVETNVFKKVKKLIRRHNKHIILDYHA